MHINIDGCISSGTRYPTSKGVKSDNIPRVGMGPSWAVYITPAAAIGCGRCEGDRLIDPHCAESS